jgi:putative endonuclease
LKYLRRKGYRLVSRNYRCPAGEIDLIVLDGEVVVFVEVKTRTGSAHADPQDAVNSTKQRHIAQAARFFLRQSDSLDRPFRFDVIAITVDAHGQMNIDHFEDAFIPVR